MKKSGQRVFPLRIHNRLMLYNTLIFLTVAYILAFVAVRYVVKADTVERMQQNRDALGALYNYYDRKHDEFIQLIFPLYDHPDNYEKLSRLLESPSDSDYETDPFRRQEIVNMLENITIRDEDIAAILIRKNLTGARYIYANHTFQKLENSPAFFDEMKRQQPGRAIYGTRELASGLDQSEQTYAIAGTIGSQQIRSDAGELLVAYKTEAMDKIYQSFAGKVQGRFMLLTGQGDIIYDSDHHYGQEKFSGIDLFHDHPRQPAELGGQRYYFQNIVSPNRNFAGLNLIPEKDWQSRRTRIPGMIYLAITGVAIVCAFLYSLTGTIVSKRVIVLVKAMRRVGSNNLSYRIPVAGRRDEFTELAAHFNKMVNELQETIQRESQAELLRTTAELKALQAGINPHFLYNTLEAIRVKSLQEGNSEVSEMIVLLANLYRGIVRDDIFIPIRKELSLCEMYILIFELRYDSCFEYTVDVEPGVLEFGIPKALLQPVAENFFVHGLRGETGFNQLSITGYRQGEYIVFDFVDNGKGLSSERCLELNDMLNAPDSGKPQGHYGLISVNERIKLVYGTDCGLSLSSESADGGARIRMTLRALSCAELEARLNTGPPISDH